MPNEFTAAFEELLDVQTETTGTSPQVKVGQVTAEAFIEKLTYDEVVVAGGVAESGGFKVMMKVSDFTAKPKRNTPVSFGDISLFIIAPVDENNGIYEITIGHPAAS